MSISYVSSTKIKLSENFDVKTNMGQQIQKAAAMQAQYKLLEQQLKEFRLMCTEYLEINNLDQLTCGDFIVSKTTRNSWTYSNKLELEIERINIDKKWEERKGIATTDPTISCTIRTSKK